MAMNFSLNGSDTTEQMLTVGALVNASDAEKPQIPVDQDAILRKLITGKWWPSFDVIIIAVLVFVILAGIGNFVVIWSFCRVPRLRKPFNVCVLGMAIGDALMTTVAAPMELFDVINNFVVPGSSWCAAKVFIRSFCFTNSLIFILIISAIRLMYGVMTFPPKPSFRSMSLLVVVVFGVSSLMSYWFSLDTSATYRLCMGILRKREDKQDIWLVLLILSIIFFVSSILCYLVLAISLRLRRGQSKMKSESKSEILTLKTAVAVTVAFAICYILPFLPAFFKSPSLAAVLHFLAIFNTLIYLQSAVNPIIYTLACRHFRVAILIMAPSCCKPVLRRACCLNGVEPLGNSTGQSGGQPNQSTVQTLSVQMTVNR